MTDKVILVGKPNVGKSSIFNTLIGKKIALVDNFPGLTRDINTKKIKIFDKDFVLIDSAGLKKPSNDLESEIRMNSLDYYNKAEILILVFDGKQCLSEEDYSLVQIIRKLNKKVIPVLNKTEGKINEFVINEFEQLGFGKPILVSAAHNQGIDDLRIIIYEELSPKVKEDNLVKPSFLLAVVGKVNSGKSTMINSLKGEKVSLTGENPNLTRDIVETEISFDDIKIKLFDTAGFIKSDKSRLKINQLSLYETNRKIRLCQMIMILVDINDYYERIHSKIIDLVYNENRCLILAINKIDSQKIILQGQIKKKIFELNPQIKDMPIFFVSGLKKSGFNELKKGIVFQFKNWKRRIKTSQLNLWLKEAVRRKPPPLHNGNLVKLKFVSQVDTGPPKFNIFTNHPRYIEKTYKRYLSNRLKSNFKMQGIPVKIIYKKTTNPYEK